MTERGAGRLKGAFGNVGARRAAGTASARGAGDGRVVRRRRRAKVGKRSRPEVYGQKNGLVRREVLERLEDALGDREVRRRLEAELSRAGIEFKKGDPDVGALYELLLDEWLESVGYGSGSGR